MSRQHGLSTLGNLFVLLVLFMFLLLGLKSIPPYIEYFSIQRIFKSLSVNPGLDDAKAVKRAFDRHATIENITAITTDDIEVSQVAVSAHYRVRVPLFGNVSLLLEFSPSSAN